MPDSLNSREASTRGISRMRRGAPFGFHIFSIIFVFKYWKRINLAGPLRARPDQKRGCKKKNPGMILKLWKACKNIRRIDGVAMAEG